MPGKEDLQRIVNDLSAVHDRVKGDDRTLESALELAASAIVLYRRFMKAYSSDSFDARVLRILPDGTTEEREFDWKSLGAAGEL